MPTPSITAPSLLQLTVKATTERPAANFRLSHNSRTGTYDTISVTVDHHMLPITSTRIVKMRLGALRREALRAALLEKNLELTSRPALKSYFKGSPGRAVADKVRIDHTIEHLETAGLVYRLARLTGDFPVQAVARSFGLEKKDAQRWTALAKKNGFTA